MLTRCAALLLVPLSVWCGDWNAKLAAKYLDGRAAEWAVWKRAAREGGPCVSCHTTLGYLMARPALRRSLGESGPTKFELGLVAGVKTRAVLALQKPSDTSKDNTPAVINALVLALDDQRRGTGLSSDTEAAFRYMWATQRREGKDKGAWGWTDANLEPWEVQESSFFGAALAAVAVGAAPEKYQLRPEIQTNIAELRAYLRGNRKSQPLANRLALLWAAQHMDGIVTDAERAKIIDEVWRGQNKDGGWMLAALGPWRVRPESPPAGSGSSAFATAWTAFLLKQAGVKTDDARLKRALDWLRTHQEPDGSWNSVSMNRRYEPGSMEERFMRDAATEYAVLALSD